jgi:membrane-associated protease RseP (regulator of RpoE activity)
MSSSFNPAVPYLTEVRPRKFPWINLALFAMTCFSTLFVGMLMMAGFDGIEGEVVFERLRQNPSVILTGWPFSLAIMSILLAHEMGHYLTSRYYGIDASLPYFIPFPNLAGTMGAFIRIRAPFQNRGSLLEVGVAGPIAGFVVAFVALIVSIGQSRLIAMDSELAKNSYHLGEPLILKLVEFVMGMTPPAGMDTFLHPVSLAAWFGFLVTALNLLPAAQLDGGHIAYGLFPRHHKQISKAIAAALIPLMILYSWVWAIWFILLVFVLKLHHPPTMDDRQPVQARHFVLGVIGLVLLILCFIPAPIRL